MMMTVETLVPLLVFAAITGGWARAALIAPAENQFTTTRIGFSLGMLDVTTVLGTLTVLFSAFLIAQLGWLFGGEQFLRARTGLTAAEYARSGFFQMTWVVLLVVPVLLVTRSALQPGRALARRHTMLSIPVIVLLGVMIVSAALRLRMYVEFFGLTIERLYPMVFMGWLGFVLVWLAATVLRGRSRAFVAGALLSGLATLAALNVSDPDGYVARVNSARSKVDVEHLSRLSGGAVPLAVAATLTMKPVDAESRAIHCRAASNLLRRYGPTAAPIEAPWRTWNFDNAAAQRVVGKNFVALARARASSCKVSGNSRT